MSDELTQVTGPSPTPATLLGLAILAEAGGNLPEANGYYTRVLELDPRSVEAWIGKGRTVGQMSTLAAPRFAEAVVAYANAIGAAGPFAQAETAERCTGEAVLLGSSLLTPIAATWRQNQHAPNVRTVLIGVCAAVIELVEAALRWTPDNQRALALMIEATSTAIDAWVGEPLSSAYRRRREEAAAALAALVPGYQLPALGVDLSAARALVTSRRVLWAFGVIAVAVFLWALVAAHNGPAGSTPEVANVEATVDNL